MLVIALANNSLIVGNISQTVSSCQLRSIT